MAAVLFCNIGVLRGILEEDEENNQRISADEAENIVYDYTDSALWKYKSFRSKKYIQDLSFLDSNINMEIVGRAIEYSDFTQPFHRSRNEVGEIAKYVRAVQIIALMSDENFERRVVEYYLSIKEAGLLDTELFPSLSEFRQNWGQYFWERLYPDVGEEILLLRETNEGRNIVSKIYSHL
jgi:hypothetical protein